MSIYFKMSFIPVMAKLNFSGITQFFILIFWFGAQELYYYQCKKQLCCLIFFGNNDNYFQDSVMNRKIKITILNKYFTYKP